MMNPIRFFLVAMLAAALAVACARGEQTGAESANPPAASQPDVKGTLVIQAVQGTANGPAVGGEKVTVELFGMAEDAPTLQARLDNHGVALIEDFQIGWGVQPVVTIEHGGTKFRQVGRIMTAASPDQHIKVAVYETTEQEPDWRIEMRHVLLEPIEGGFYVREVLALDNPADRAWIGAADPQSGQRTTVTVPLPPGYAKRGDLQAGPDPAATRVTDERVTSGLPLLPGQTTCRFAYYLRYEGGGVDLELTAPRPTDQVMVSVPHGIGKVTAEGLAPVERQTDEAEEPDRYIAGPVAAGAKVSLRIAAPPAGSASAALASGPGLSPGRVLAILGGGVVVLIGLAMLWFRRPGKPETEKG